MRTDSITQEECVQYEAGLRTEYRILKTKRNLKQKTALGDNLVKTKKVNKEA